MKMIKAETAYNDMFMVKSYIDAIDQATIDEAEQLIACLKKYINGCLISYKEDKEV